MPSFADRVKAWGDKARDRVDATHRGAALEVLTRVVMKTPVDKGGARGSWQVTLDGPVTAAIERLDVSGSAAMAAGASIIQAARAGQTIYVTSALPYIVRLEQGHSKQGDHMVATTAAEWDDIVSLAAKAAERAHP
ncbi:hypothetical protein [Maricaulis sp. MIT060901]|uniref:hypothetical protein n=1 Tax=Maricaulis sp. MIT060901 TaxID=3096993 RepID=UPI00399B2011